MTDEVAIARDKREQELIAKRDTLEAELAEVMEGIDALELRMMHLRHDIADLDEEIDAIP